MIDKIFALDAQWLWLSLAVLLAAAEMLVPGFFLIWIGAAALVTGVAALFGASVSVQLALFAVLSVAAVYAGKRWFSVNPITSDDPMLNNRGARMVGQIGTVSDVVDANGGRIALGDSMWPARSNTAHAGAAAGAALSIGTRVRVTGVQNGVATVEAAD